MEDQAAPAPSGSDGTIRVVAAAILYGGALLLVRKRGTSAFMLPGGKAEPGEHATETLTRELAEELGCGLTHAGVVLLGRFVAPAANEPGRTVHATVYRGMLDGVPRIGAEIAQMLWYDLDRVPSDGTGPDDTVSVPLAPLLTRHVLPALRRQAGRA
ncbi:NUDIX domain-containing protein [Nguyenibacter sp. L1]|uniref:NUDIX hydrolase n=1 Tax=Nguyenibacter sp. L1 TaxID=3049350 RepID=UPI002B46F7C0|nr:NUDIX domain-containing protein [Nguyenibacter sp. L1]WRH87543.1 NUDIX domain-containing protein [Nguyenibacter sp. L1]